MIFQSGTAYKDLRKMLVENYLYAVVSLPAGIFNPYSGVKTSILLMDKELSKKSNEILFVKVANDGFNLGAQRNAVKGGQLDDAIEIIREFVGLVQTPDSVETPKLGVCTKLGISTHATVETQCIGDSNIIGNRVVDTAETQCIASLPHAIPTPNPQYADIAHAVPKSVIAKNGDYNLSGERYKETISKHSSYPFANLGDICVNYDGKRVPITRSDRIEGVYPYFGASGIVDYVEDFLFNEDLLLVSEDGANLLARSTPIAFSVSGKIWVNNHAHVLKFDSIATQKYVEYILNSMSLEPFITGSAQPKLNQKALNSIQIPLPPSPSRKK